MESFDLIKFFTPDPIHAFRMPFLIVTEVLKGEKYFSEYFAGFRGNSELLLSTRILMDYKKIPQEIGVVPGFLTDQAKIMGIDSIQNLLDEEGQKADSHLFSRVIMTESSSVKHFALARFFVPTNIVKKILGQTQSLSLQNFLNTLQELPEITVEK